MEQTRVYLDTGLKAELKAYAALKGITLSEALKRAAIQMLTDNQRYKG